MKHFVTLFLAAVILLQPFVMGWTFIRMYQNSVQTAKLDASTTWLIKMPVALYVSAANTDFEQVHEPLKVGKQLFVVTQKRIYNDSLEMYCTRNTVAEHYLSLYNECLNVFGSNDNEGPEKDNLFKVFEKKFTLLEDNNKLLVHLGVPVASNELIDNTIFYVALNFLGVETPPPNIFV